MTYKSYLSTYLNLVSVLVTSDKAFVTNDGNLGSDQAGPTAQHAQPLIVTEINLTGLLKHGIMFLI